MREGSGSCQASKNAGWLIIIKVAFGLMVIVTEIQDLDSMEIRAHVVNP